MTAPRPTPSRRQRLIFPLFNALVFGILFAVVGYYAFDITRWLIVGLVAGLGFGLIVEFGLGLIGGWLYRRRVLFAVLLEVILTIAVFGPFVIMYIDTRPHPRDMCCLETSGLGDQAVAVTIPVADGETLAGWYAPPATTPGPVIMVLHGSSSDRRGSLNHARVLRAAGYGVLVYDQRALGESSGDRTSYGLYDQRDIPLIIDWLSARPEVDATHIGGVGLSLGAHILIMAAPDEPRLQAIWSDGLGINTIDDLPDSFDGIANDFLAFIYGQEIWLTELYLDDQFVPITQLIPQIAPRHLMLVAGTQDTKENDFNAGYAPLLGANGELWIIENAKHVGGLYTVPDEYESRLIAFFDAAFASP